MKKEELVIKPNSIAEARGKILPNTLDLLDITIHSIIKKPYDDPEQLEYYITASDYTEKFGFNETRNAYRKLKELTYDVMYKQKVVAIYIDGHIDQFFIFQEAEYYQDEMMVRVMFSQRFKKLLVDEFKRKGKKIYYELPQTLRMKSEYSKRFYPILLERTHKTINDRMTFSAKGTLKGKKYDRIDRIENFREQLHIPSSYKVSRLKDICQRIVDDVNNLTPYMVSVEYNELAIGRGRPATTHICWKIEKKKISKKTEYDIDGYKKIIKSIFMKRGIDISDKEVIGIANDAIKNGVGIEDISERINYAIDRKNNVDSVVAYARGLMRKYTPPKATKKHLDFNDFDQRDFDYDALERELNGW